MELLVFMILASFPVISDGFTVRGPSAPLSAPLGSSVVLTCYVDEALPVKDLEVEWRRADSETLIHLYQDGESRAEVQQQDYHDRAHFFTEEIQHGNFSLRLDNLTVQDEGEYRCRVHRQQDSAETVAQIKDVERLLVSGSDESIFVSVGGEVTLNCSVDSHITPEHIEEVSWRKTDKGGDILVLLYQNNETISESSHERYKGRVKFFTAEIPKGNFSLRLKSVRTEDKGVYMCQVFAGDLSANVTVELGRAGFSVLHIMMMFLCMSAFGSALLLCFLIYRRSQHTGLFLQQTYDGFCPLGSSVVLPCHVDRELLKKKLKVEWKRRNTLVHLYQDGESRPEKQHKDYENRAHFTEHVQYGNFSLRLDNLRVEDAGKYTCAVHSVQECVYSEAKLKTLLKLGHSPDSRHVHLGGSLVLPCQVDKNLNLKKKNLKVEWRRSDSETLVHLYQTRKCQLKKQHRDYRHRAHFDKKKIKKGNFSLRLEKLRAEDAGKYRCEVYSDQECVHSAETEVVIVGFQVKHTRHTLASLGSSVVLPCYGEKPSSVQDLKVEWRRSWALIHLYKDGGSRSLRQQQDYYDRAHFFTEEIQHGNFSLRLDNLRDKDAKEYTCTVYRKWRQVFSVKTKIILRLLETVFRLQMFLVVCPNILMCFAFLLWGLTEGSLNESVSCCALYFLRPLMLLYAAPYIEEFTGKINRWILKYSYIAEYVFLSVAIYSALLVSSWQRILNFAEFDRVLIIVLFIIVFLSCFCKVIYFLVADVGKIKGRAIEIFDAVALMIFEILPTLQFMLLFYTFGSAKAGLIIVIILPVLMMMMNDRMFDICYYRLRCSDSATRTVMLIFTIVTNAVMIGFYIFTLDDKTDAAGWGCVIVLLQILWIIIKFTDDNVSYWISFSTSTVSIIYIDIFCFPP